MLKDSFWTLLRIQSIFGQAVEQDRLYPTVKVPVNGGHSYVLPTNTENQNTGIVHQIQAPGRISPIPHPAVVTCPVLSIENLNVDDEEFQIVPAFKTYDRGSIIPIKIKTSNSMFKQFFLQVKDGETGQPFGDFGVASTDPFNCDKSKPEQMDTFRIENYEGDAIDVTWKPLSPPFDLPTTIVFVGSFRSEEGNYKEIKSAVVKRRSDVSLKECCEMEFPKSLHNGDCARMCEKHSIVEALSSALEHCKSEIYKLQRCYHTESFVNSEDTDPIEVSKLIARSDMERKGCCESDSVTQDCLGLCDGAQTLFWSKQYSKCSSVNRQIYSCWSRTTCVGRCNDKPRTDHKCQCDLDCMMRGDCCLDMPFACKVDLPIKVSYWPSQSLSCAKIINFSDYQRPKGVHQMENLLIDPQKPSPYVALGLDGFVGKLKTFFNVKIDGAYRFYFMLGSKDFGQVKIDGIKVAEIICSANPKPLQVDLLLPFGGHKLEIVFAHTGGAHQLKVAYEGPDTAMRPSKIQVLKEADVFEMGLPAEIAATTSTTAVPITRPGEILVKSTTTKASIGWNNPNVPSVRPKTRRPAPTRPPETARPLSKSSEEQKETERFDIRIIVGLSLGVFVGIVAIGLIFKYLK